jgi:nucleolar complex protein 3
LNKPVCQIAVDDLPSVDSHDEDGSWNSVIGGSDMLSFSSLTDSESDDNDQTRLAEMDSDVELPYETMPRPQRNSMDSEDERVQHLPIKLANGRIQQTKRITTAENTKDTKEDPVVGQSEHIAPTVEDVSTGARFGKPAVVDVVGNKSRKARIQGAKEQIAGICQEIISEPENSVRLTRDHHSTF